MYSNWAQFKVKERAPDSQEKTTLLAMASYADDDGWSVFMTEETLAHHIGKSVRTVRRHIRALEARGELVVFPQWYAGKKQNEYVITCAEPMTTEREGRKAVPERQLALPIPDVSQSQYEVVADMTTDQRLAQLGVFRKKGKAKNKTVPFTQMADNMTGKAGHDNRQGRTSCPPYQSDTSHLKTNPDLFHKENMKDSERDRLAVSEGHSADVMALLKENSPQLYKEMMNFAENASMENALNSTTIDPAKQKRKDDTRRAYAEMAAAKGFATVEEYRQSLTRAPQDTTVL